MISQQTLRYELLAASDAHRLSEVAIRVYRDHYLHLWHDGGGWYIARSFAPAVLEQELLDPNARFYLIHLDDVAVGFLKLNIDRPSVCHPSQNALELERIYLAKAATGRGIGSRVVQFVLAEARQMGKEAVWLKAMDSSHEAIAFYRKMGFVLCGTSRLPFEVMHEAFRGMVSMEHTL